MSKSRPEIKVGLFVTVCLVILAVLMLQFSKGTTFFRPTYLIYLKAGNVGGLRAKSSVLMSGVQVGTVSQTTLSPEGTNVTITLKIYKQFVIHRNARFIIEQAGFLGDEYVAIYPGDNSGAVLQDKDEADAQSPFNLIEVARNAAGFIERIDETAQKLNAAINDVRRLVLNEQTLTNLAVTVGNFRRVSESAMVTVDDANALIVSNRPAFAAVSNLMAFSEQLKSVGVGAQDLLRTNSPQIALAISNVVDATSTLTNLLSGVQAGHGLAGVVLKNEALANDMSNLASNLAFTSQTLNEQGLWRVIWGPKHHATNATPAITAPPAATPHSQGRDTF